MVNTNKFLQLDGAKYENTLTVLINPGTITSVTTALAMAGIGVTFPCHKPVNAVYIPPNVPNWSSTTTYAIGNFVVSPNNSTTVWSSLINNNLNNQPGAGSVGGTAHPGSDSNWQLVSYIAWDSLATYAAGDVVTSTPANMGSGVFKSIAGGNLNHAPTGFDTDANWTILSVTAVEVKIKFDVVNTTGGDGGVGQLAWGVGAAPGINGATTGTLVGNSHTFVSANATVDKGELCWEWIIPNIIPGTTIWVDLQYATATGGSVTFSNGEAILKEL